MGTACVKHQSVLSCFLMFWPEGYRFYSSNYDCYSALLKALTVAMVMFLENI